MFRFFIPFYYVELHTSIWNEARVFLTKRAAYKYLNHFRKYYKLTHWEFKHISFVNFWEDSGNE